MCGTDGRLAPRSILVVVHATVVHLVAASKVPLLALLSQTLRATASVRWWTSVPPVSALRTGDFLVIDLLDGGRLVQPSTVARVLSRAHVFLVTGTTSVAPDWLELARQEPIRVVRCLGCSSGERFVKLVAAIEAETRGPTGAEMAAHVLEREARFAPVADIVKIICERPWETRRPADLAGPAGLRLPALKHALGALGFRRVEHFIVAVRLIAFEELVGRGHVPPSTARRLVGLIDPANVSRQLRRARVGSPAAFRDLAVSRG
jgi:hypothetical protein